MPKYTLLLTALVFLAGCRNEPPLPVLGEVPPFQFTDQDGRQFRRASLDGNLWVADFIFTNCHGPCPLMTTKMRRLQDAVAKYPDVRLVSFTIDPDNDTPAVLASYAQRYRADTARWFFLTGDKWELDNLGRDHFKLHTLDASMAHSTRFVLLDRRSRIRGYYSSEEDGMLDRLLADIRRLRQEPS